MGWLIYRIKERVMKVWLLVPLGESSLEIQVYLDAVDALEEADCRWGPDWIGEQGILVEKEVLG